jgi:hypothetical protein
MSILPDTVPVGRRTSRHRFPPRAPILPGGKGPARETTGPGNAPLRPCPEAITPPAYHHVVPGARQYPLFYPMIFRFGRTRSEGRQNGCRNVRSTLHRIPLPRRRHPPGRCRYASSSPRLSPGAIPLGVRLPTSCRPASLREPTLCPTLQRPCPGRGDRTAGVRWSADDGTGGVRRAETPRPFSSRHVRCHNRQRPARPGALRAAPRHAPARSSTAVLHPNSFFTRGIPAGRRFAALSGMRASTRGCIADSVRFVIAHRPPAVRSRLRPRPPRCRALSR